MKTPTLILALLLAACSPVLQPYPGPSSDPPSISFRTVAGKRSIVVANPGPSILRLGIDCDVTSAEIDLPPGQQTSILAHPWDRRCTATGVRR